MENNNYSGGSVAQTARGGSNIDNIKETVADKLRAAAGAIEQRVQGAGPQNSTVNQYGHQASHWLNASADYVQDMDVEQIKANVQEQVRTNPGRSLLIAGAAGLLLGVLLRR